MLDVTHRSALGWSPSTDERWMALWLDTDGDAATGCAGFDYAVNRTRTANGANVDHCADAKAGWQRVGDAELVVAEQELLLAVPRNALVLPASAASLSFRFKWTDNVPEPLAALDLLQLGTQRCVRAEAHCTGIVRACP